MGIINTKNKTTKGKCNVAHDRYSAVPIRIFDCRLSELSSLEGKYVEVEKEQERRFREGAVLER